MAEYIIETKDNRWEVICGLEIHCQIISKSKMFSGASTVSAPMPTSMFLLSTPACRPCCRF